MRGNSTSRNVRGLMACLHRLGLCAAARLLDAYLELPPGEDVGALAGTVVSDPGQQHFLARYATDRGFLDQEAGLHTAADAAATANLAVRRTAFDEIGGFTEGIRSGGDVDLCRRLTEAGWKIERRPDAVVTHLHRESLPDLMGSIARYAAGARWLNERYPGTAPAWPLGARADPLRQGHRGRPGAAAASRRRRSGAWTRSACSPTRSATAARTTLSPGGRPPRARPPGVRRGSRRPRRRPRCRTRTSSAARRSPRSPSFFTRGTTWQWRCGTDCETTLFIATNEPWAPIASRTATERR